MTKTKICLIVSGLSTGGVEIFIQNFFNKIDKSSYELYLMTHNLSSNEIREKYEKIGFKILYIPPKKNNLIKSIKTIDKFMKEYKFDIVHSNLVKSNFLYLYFAKKNNVKFTIAHSHNCFKYKNLLKKIILKIIQKLNLKYADYYIGCSKDALLCGFGRNVFNTKKYKILYNAIEINKFKFSQTNRDNIRKKYNIKENQIVLGNIARFTEQKNHKFLIKVFNNLLKYKKDFVLILIGEGKLKSKIEKKIKKLKICENIIFLAPVNDIEKYYSAFDLFLLPSKYEGFPITIIEALTNGLDVITSNQVLSHTNFDKGLLKLKCKCCLWVKTLINYKEKRNKESLINVNDFNINNSYNELKKIYDGAKYD